MAFNSALKLPERAPTKTRLHVSIDMQLLAWAHQQSTHAQLSPLALPSLYPLRHSHDKLFQALYHFSVLQVTESLAGPVNESIVEPLSGKTFLMGKFPMQIIITAKVFRSPVELLLTSNTMATCQYSQNWCGQILAVCLHL